MEREARNSLRCQNGCLGINGGCFSTVVAVAAAVAALPLPNVLWWALTRSQVG